MNLESLDKFQSDAELRKAIIYLCKYGSTLLLLIDVTRENYIVRSPQNA